MACTARSKRIHRRALLTAAALALFAGPAQAARMGSLHLGYIDPGAGSFILQALVATVAGAAVAVSAYWRRIKRFLGFGPPEDEAAPGEPPSGDE